MGRRVRLGSALVAGTLAFVVVGTSTAHAILSQTGYKCQTAIANEAGKYVKGKLKLIQKCKDANLATPGSCLAPDPAALTKLDDKLNAGLAKKCSFDGLDADNLARLGFPGPCADVSGSGQRLHARRSPGLHQDQPRRSLHRRLSRRPKPRRSVHHARGLP